MINKKAILLVNTKSRNGADLFADAKKLLVDKGIELIDAQAITNPKNLYQIVERALAKDPELLVVGSGDGTISAVSAQLAHSTTILGFIPLGTTNNFARSVGIPIELDAAIDVIANGKAAKIDLGKVNDNYFVNAATIGVSVDIAHAVSDGLKRFFGRSAYALTSLRILMQHKPFNVTIKTADNTHRFKTHQLVIANGRFHAGNLIAKDASIDNHSFVIFHLGDRSRLQLLRSMILFALKKPRTLAEGNFIVTKQAEITTHPSHNVELDGEIKASTPVTISTVPAALKIMVPQDFTD